jgi:hypothetical protein
MKKKTELKSISDAEFKKLMLRIAELLDGAVKNFREAGEIVVRLVDNDRFTLRYLNQQWPYLSIAKLKLLERIGRNDFHPVLMTPGNAGEAMLVQMAYADQVAALDKGEQVVVVTMAADGTFGTALLPASALTSDQVNQVSRFVGNKRVYVSEAEQQAWLIDHRTNLNTRASRPGAAKYRVKDGLVWVGSKHFTPAELIAAANEAMNPPPAVEI